MKRYPAMDRAVLPLPFPFEFVGGTASYGLEVIFFFQVTKVILSSLNHATLTEMPMLVSKTHVYT
jgi:hypothetical protein